MVLADDGCTCKGKHVHLFLLDTITYCFVIPTVSRGIHVYTSTVYDEHRVRTEALLKVEKESN